MCQIYYNTVILIKYLGHMWAILRSQDWCRSGLDALGRLHRGKYIVRYGYYKDVLKHERLRKH